MQTEKSNERSMANFNFRVQHAITKYHVLLSRARITRELACACSFDDNAVALYMCVCIYNFAKRVGSFYDFAKLVGSS